MGQGAPQRPRWSRGEVAPGRWAGGQVGRWAGRGCGPMEPPLGLCRRARRRPKPGSSPAHSSASFKPSLSGGFCFDSPLRQFPNIRRRAGSGCLVPRGTPFGRIWQWQRFGRGRSGAMGKESQLPLGGGKGAPQCSPCGDSVSLAGFRLLDQTSFPQPSASPLVS